MKKLHEKSIVLGIGIGMIITSIAGLIYSTGTQKELSKEEIISLAKRYGLVEPANIIEKDNISGNTTIIEPDNSTNSGNTDTSKNTATQSTGIANNSQATETTDKAPQKVEQQTETSKRDISIAVQSGFGSKQVAKALLEKGVISNEKEFETVLDSYNASQKIRTGTYLFKKHDDLHYIVKTICKFK